MAQELKSLREMSELIAYDLVDIQDYRGNVYLKSEADKVISHNKYKRCLLLAKWCDSENYTACWYHENSERCKWTERWHKRWLELAEKFKPNSTAQQGKG